MDPAYCQYNQLTPIFEHSIVMFEKKVAKGKTEAFYSFLEAMAGEGGEHFIFQSESLQQRTLDLASKMYNPSLYGGSALTRPAYITNESTTYDLAGLDEHGEFSTTHYLRSKKIEHYTLLNGNGKYAISLSDFVTIFNSDEHPKALAFIAQDIDAVLIDNQKIAPLYLIPPKYLRAIQELWLSKEHLDIAPPKEISTDPSDIRLRSDMDRIHCLFSNATKVYGLHPYKLEPSVTIQQNPLYGYALRAQLFLQIDPARAREDVEIVMARNPTCPLALSTQATLLFSSEKYDEAEEVVRQILAVHPKHIRAYELLATILCLKKCYIDMQDVLERTLQLNPKSTHAYTGKAMRLYYLKEIDEAEQMVNKALTLDPEYAHAYRVLSELFACRGLWDRAKQALTKAIYIEPGSEHNYQMEKMLKKRIKAAEQAQDKNI